MKKLEDLSRDNIFKVPDGYFEQLPGIIQARVAKPAPQPWFIPVLKFAIPVLFVAAMTVWFTSGNGTTIEDQLSKIQTEQLIAYLEESELSVDLVSEEVSLMNEDDLLDLEERVLSSITPLDITLEDLNHLPDNF